MCGVWCEVGVHVILLHVGTQVSQYHLWNAVCLLMLFDLFSLLMGNPFWE